MSSLRRHLPVAITIVLSALLASAAPSIAAAVQKALFAENSDRVDGIHAKPYTTNAAQREKKLVGANNSGYLPNNIIKKAPDSNELNGLETSRYLDRGPATFVVDKSGKGDFKQIQPAVDKAATVATPAQRGRVLVLRGTYEEHVTLPSDVDLEGVGIDRPVITCACAHAANTNTDGATLNISGSTVKNLFVRNQGGADFGQAISALGDGNKLVDVTGVASGALNLNVGVRVVGGDAFLRDVHGQGIGGNIPYGLRAIDSDTNIVDSTFIATSADQGLSPENRGMSLEEGTHDLKQVYVRVSASGSTPSLGIYSTNQLTMSDSEIEASGGGNAYYGLLNASGNAELSNVKITAAGGSAQYGIYNHNASANTILVERSTIIVSGAGYTIRNVGSGFTVRVAASRLHGPTTLSSAGSVVTCAGVYDENFVYSASICPGET